MSRRKDRVMSEMMMMYFININLMLKFYIHCQSLAGKDFLEAISLHFVKLI